MLEKYEKKPSNLENFETVTPKEGMNVKQVLEIMKKENLRPASIRDIMEALGHNQKEIDEMYKSLEIQSEETKED